MHIYIHVCAHMHMYVYAHTHMCLCVFVFVFVFVFVRAPRKHTNMRGSVWNARCAVHPFAGTIPRQFLTHMKLITARLHNMCMVRNILLRQRHSAAQRLI